MAFQFLQRTNLGDLTRQFKLVQYVPALTLERLNPGVDNVRHDVFLSRRFCEKAGSHIRHMHAKYGQVEDLAVSPTSGDTSVSFRPPSVVQPRHGTAQRPQQPVKPEADFKALLSDLLTAALTRARSEGNINIDLLARVAVIKFLRAELLTQFNVVLERCRAKLQSFDSVRTASQHKAIEARERVAYFQVNKKHILRKTGQELFETMREAEKETLARMRRSLVGDESSGTYDLFLNRLLFTEDGKDDYLNAEHYVMIGNYERDPDRLSRIIAIASQFLESMNALSISGEYATYEAILSAPENAQELAAGGSPDEGSAKGKAQKAVLTAWTETLEREGIIERIGASYEVVPLLVTYWPHVHAQQLKGALLLKDQYQRVTALLEEHGKLSPDPLNQTIKRLQAYKPADRIKLAGRFLFDFMRLRRDLRRMEAVLAACEKVNVVTSDKLRELSSINNTLYEFQLGDEQKTGEDKVTCHAILKSDIRDSTGLTRTMLERGLNPASFFSLNVYDPVNKLIAHHGATKVFIEGDAIILALFDREGEPGFCVSRTCVVARDMIQVVHAYNQKSQAEGLPLLELGIGIAFQDSAPMYLMDGNNKIMISDAINVSDRLSGCTKGAKKFITTQTPFNVFEFQTVEESTMGSSLDEFLIRYNVGGITLNQPAFDKLSKEISLEVSELMFPLLWGNERVRFYSGLVPMAQGSFHKIHIREVPVAHVDAATHALKQWTSLRFYEVITNSVVCDQIEARADAVSA
jgi:class 3 adenylate cyclase